jgi:4-diphosphocytidyl-2C-methyl-D-erythritol kinase
VVVKPDVGVSTGGAYSSLDDIESRVPGQSTEHMLQALDSGRPDLISECLSNDFELAVLPEYPVILEIRDSTS